MRFNGYTAPNPAPGWRLVYSVVGDDSRPAVHVHCFTATRETVARLAPMARARELAGPDAVVLFAWIEPAPEQRAA